MKKIELIRIKPWERKDYPNLYTKTELKEQKLMPAPNVKPRAVVERPQRYGGNYDLYTIEKTVPFRKTVEQKKKEAKARKLRKEKKIREELRKKQLQNIWENIWIDFQVPDSKYETVVIDFETTGVDPSVDEILQVAIIDQDGNELMNRLCRPIVLQEWPYAQDVHGITPATVKKKPSFLDLVPEIADILMAADEVIAYNDSFEAGFLTANGIPAERLPWGDDPMKVYASLYNEGKYAKLCNAAAEFGYTFDAHDALEDVRATLFLHQQLNKDCNNDKEIDCDYKDLAY